jgi:hypothetical protein
MAGRPRRAVRTIDGWYVWIEDGRLRARYRKRDGGDVSVSLESEGGFTLNEALHRLRLGIEL